MKPYINYTYMEDNEPFCGTIRRRDLHMVVPVAQPFPSQGTPPKVVFNFVYVRNQWPTVIRAVTDLLTALVWSSNIKHANEIRHSSREERETKAPTLVDSLITIASFCGVLAICGLTCGLIGDQQNDWSTRLRELFPSSLSGWKNASTGFYLAALLLPFLAIPALVLTFTPVSAVIGVIGTALLWSASTALSALLGFRITNEWLQSGVDKTLLENHLLHTTDEVSAVRITSYSNNPPEPQALGRAAIHADYVAGYLTSSGCSSSVASTRLPPVPAEASYYSDPVARRLERAGYTERRPSFPEATAPPLTTDGDTPGPFGKSS